MTDIYSTKIAMGIVHLEPGAVAAAERLLASSRRAPYYYAAGAVQSTDASSAAWLAPTLHRLAAVAQREFGQEYELKHAWVNSTPPGGYIKSHLHHGVSVSGVLYLSCADDSGDLVLIDPRPAFRTTREYSRSQDARVVPAVGGYVIFPSWLEHEVEPNRSAINRISAAFDLIERG